MDKNKDLKLRTSEGQEQQVKVRLNDEELQETKNPNTSGQQFGQVGEIEKRMKNIIWKRG